MPSVNFPLFELAIVKGIIEHNDGTSYFGSLMGYMSHLNSAVNKGYVTHDEATRKTEVTELGRAEYERLNLSELPQKRLSRAYMWDWSKAEAILFPPPPKTPRRRKKAQ